MTGFARSVPRNLLNGKPILFVEAACPEVTGGERSGIASMLVDADTSVGDDICLGLIRFRGTDPDVSLNFGIEGDFLKAAVAASAFCRISIANCAESTYEPLPEDGVMIFGIVGDREFRFTVLDSAALDTDSGDSSTWLDRCIGNDTCVEDRPRTAEEDGTCAGIAWPSKPSAPKSASASARCRRPGLEIGTSAVAVMVVVGLSASRTWEAFCRGDSMLSTTDSRSALALAI